MGLPFPHAKSPGGPVRCTVVDAIDVALVADETKTACVHLTDQASGRRLLWKFDPAVGHQVAAAILNLCDEMEKG